ncbi:hypothetical protein, partial [Angustibacter aerolatus]
MGDDVQLTTWLHRARTLLHALEHVSAYVTDPRSVLDDVQAAAALVEEAPSGDAQRATDLADRAER